MIVTQFHLLEVVRRLRKVASPSANTPSHSYVRCTHDALGTHFVAVDSDRFLTITLPSSVGTSELSRKLAALTLAREAADFLVPIDTLIQVSKAADKLTRITIEPNGLSYVTGGIEAFTAIASEIALHQFPVSEIQTWPIEATTANPFFRAVQEGLSHVSKDQTRYVLNGMLYSAKGEAVATDGRRLYLREGLPSMKADAIIPTETCKLVEAGMTICFSKPDKDERRYVRFTKDGSLTIRLTSKLVDGNFPNFRQVIPDEKQVVSVVRVDPESLASTIRKANVCNPKEKSIKLEPSPGVLAMTGKNGSFKVSAAVEGVLGDGRTGYEPHISFNQDFLCDALDVGLGRISLINTLSPGFFTSPAKPRVMVVLMPMRLTADDKAKVSK